MKSLDFFKSNLFNVTILLIIFSIIISQNIVTLKKYRLSRKNATELLQPVAASGLIQE